MLAGLGLAAPGVVEVAGAAEAAGHSVAFGLAGLRVPLEAGDVRGTFAPLTGLAVALWGLASGVRRLAPRWPGARRAHVVFVAVAFSVVAAAAAVATPAVSEVEPSAGGAAIAGFLWGGAGALLGTRPGAATPLNLRLRSLRLGPSVLEPGIAGAVAAVAVAVLWFFVAVAVWVAGVPLRAVAGGILLALAAAPNAIAGLLAVGLGAPVDAVLGGTALGSPLSESLSLWAWGRGGAPWHVLALVLAPAAGAVAAGWAAAGATPDDATVVRGLRNGAVMGGIVAVAGWVGSLSAAAGAGAERLAVRLGFSPLVAFGLALAWGVAGAFAGGAARSRVRAR